ncbi:MAG: 16S rRNA (cytidine(1402)-2'-O)-methyltransferase [Deltaproteobacteria bacterium]|nr:MAG: 16S rRNA (cytidine(1402)-2'-O)-methyltransferase [Deltaproteobacteria bacterium]
MEPRSQLSGTLFVVATPIGNLGDITFRAVEILKGVDVIAAEGVNRTRGLCQYYGIKTKVRRFNQHNQRRRAQEFLSLLKAGRDVALVTNAGTPGISDPGAFLVSKALEAGISISVVPGPSAVTAALSVAGIPSERFVFLGFLPAREGPRRRELSRWRTQGLPLVLFEAPHRLKDTLADIVEIMNDPQVALLRELTKAYEEVRRQKASEILASLGLKGIKGEIVLVVQSKADRDDLLDPKVMEDIKHLMKKEGTPLREVATRLSEQTGLPYRRLYKACLEVRRLEGAEGIE